MSTATAETLPNDPNLRGDVVISEPTEGREALVRGEHDFHSITETVCKVNEYSIKDTPTGFKAMIGVGGALFTFFVLYVGYLIWIGPGIWGNNNPVGWAWDIVNFVFWVGIGHAGTLISAILYLFRSPWRTVVYRATEAMTVFAVMTAGLFPIVHIGRQWFFYWLLPYPNQRFLWPNFKSPLIWDVFAIGTYLTVSTTFLVVGLVLNVVEPSLFRVGGPGPVLRVVSVVVPVLLSYGLASTTNSFFPLPLMSKPLTTFSAPMLSGQAG